MSAELEGLVAVVAGAGSPDDTGVGVGAATARLFAQEGARVVIFNRSTVSGNRTRDLITESGGTAIAVEGQVEDAAACARAVQAAAESFGKIDVLVNCVGTTGTGEGTDEEFHRIMGSNVLGMIHMVDAFIPAADKTHASIVSISSIAAWRPSYRGGVAYNLSKAAVLSFTQTIAVKYGGIGIRANTVSAGGQWTPMAERALRGNGRTDEEVAKARTDNWRATLLQSEGTAWDVANAALFLASPRSRWITGINLIVDGGATNAPRAVQDIER